MKIVIDGRWISKPAGLGIMTRELVSHLAEEDKSNKYIIYISKKEDHSYVPKNPRFTYRVVAGPYPIAEQLIIPLALLIDKPDVFHAALGTAPAILPKAKLTLTLADAMFLMPQEIVPRRLRLYQRFGSTYRKLVVPLAFKRARAVTTISEKSKQDIERYLGNKTKVDVVYLAQSQEFRAAPEGKKMEGNYAFALSATDPRKYTKELLTSYSKARVKTTLILAGSIDKLLVRNLGRKAKFLGRVDQHELIKLYQGAKYFIYPSLYEAFGIPLLEAMACGTPVLALRTGANREIAGDAAHLVDKNNLTEAIRLIDSDENLRKGLREKGLKRSRDFSWSKTAKDYLEVYKKVYR